MKYIDQYQGADVSFWEVFPAFREVKYFKNLYKEDRSKGKNKSSKVMWYLVLSNDIDGEFYTMEDDEKHEVITDALDFDPVEYLKGGADKLNEITLDFIYFIDTPLSSHVRALYRKLEERKKFIIDTPYSLDTMVYPDPNKGENFKPYKKAGTAKDLDKMFTDSKKLFDEVKSLEEALKEERMEEGKGGKKASFMEG